MSKILELQYFIHLIRFLESLPAGIYLFGVNNGSINA